MNKLVSAAIGLIMASGVSAQTSYDALKLFKSDLTLGNARYAAMGGAMGALGADLSSVKDNPAGLGVYSKSDISITPNIYINNDSKVGLNVNNFGVALNFGKSGNKKGYVNSTLAATYHKLNIYNKKVNFYDEDLNMTDADEFFDPQTTLAKPVYFVEGGSYKEEGSVNEWDISYGMNISNRIFWGIGFGFTSASYDNYSFTEQRVYDDASNDEIGYLSLDDIYEMEADGFNIKAGVIGKFTDWFRAGIALHTPTFYYRVSDYASNVTYTKEYSGSYKDRYDSECDWNLQTPWKAQIDLGFIIAKKASVGVGYTFQDYSAMDFSDIRGYGGENGIIEDTENEIANEFFKPVHTFRIGSEIVITKNIFGRVGFAYETSGVDLKKETRMHVFSKLDGVYHMTNAEAPTKYPVSYDEETIEGGIGVGFRGKYFYSDIAFVHKIQKNSFYDYLPRDEAFMTKDTKFNNIMATFGFKF